MKTTAPSTPPSPRHPLRDLLARYRDVFRVAWERRAELAGPRRLADEQAFFPAALSLQETPVHPAPRRLAWLLMALFGIALAWACLGRIDIVAVAQGRIIVSDRTKLVQPLENSVVRRVLVREGEHVVAGQPLLELDPTSAQADRTSFGEAHRSAESESLRVRALQDALKDAGPVAPPRWSTHQMPAGWSPQERADAQAQLTAEWSDITARLARLDAERQRREAEIATVRAMVAKLEATLPGVRQRERDFETLAAQGFISGHATQDRTRERVEMERDLATQQARLQEALAALAEARQSRTSYLAETRRALGERQAQADLKREQSAQEVSKAERRERLATLVAPVSGTVQQLAAHTEGGVVTEAQALMVIVPDGAQVSAEVTLENKDIGFVEPAQEVTIKLETFPFTRYGTVGARVETVTGDAVADEKRGAIFPALLKLDQTHIAVDGKDIRLAPGMNLTAEIKTGQRRVIEYLLSPIQKAGSESLRER
ncbi:HlyD family type I secretion periplasmic adaptor subunit [Paracidovorax anthurii]|uniref:Membrane fusion protein (MFP) family protein n=1 Tax=Paracidovorax anthurii TaxID=78229 RepID=A0A328Y999_9BURK|nr:HlyD family type I secretion periplasmic adaptor subunit [Paracidovorax anthurii]RAR70170.1 hemolysin D [Paracidovorax anthurii]